MIWYWAVNGTMRVFLRYIMAVIIFALAFWGITYTSDWKGYEYYFNNDLTMKSDLATFYIFNFLKQHGILDYRVAYRVHIALMSLLYPLIFVRFKKNPIPYTILLIVFTYVPLANQIRFYVALPMAILSIIAYTERHLFIAIVFCALSLSFHTTVIILFVSYLLYNQFVVKNKNRDSIVLYFLIGLILAFLVSPIISHLPSGFADSYSEYSEGESLSSLAGGLYTIIPMLVALTAVFYAHSRVNRYRPDIILKNKKHYYLLISLSVATAILIPIGFTMQIFVNRFVSSMLVFQVLFLSFIQSKSLLNGKKIVLSGWIVAVLVINLLWQTVVPYWLHISSFPISTELLLIIQSYSL